jgi:hypothetical protein
VGDEHGDGRRAGVLEHLRALEQRPARSHEVVDDEDMEAGGIAFLDLDDSFVFDAHLGADDDGDVVAAEEFLELPPETFSGPVLCG